jgi:hypothetical protein
MNCDLSELLYEAHVNSIGQQVDIRNVVRNIVIKTWVSNKISRTFSNIRPHPTQVRRVGIRITRPHNGC